MRYSNEAVIVHNRGLARALWRLALAVAAITVIGQAIYKAADGDYTALLVRLGVIYLLSFGLRS